MSTDARMRANMLTARALALPTFKLFISDVTLATQNYEIGAA